MQESRFTVEKNKTFPPHRTGAFWFSTQNNPKGKAGEIYRAGEIITYGVLSGVIERSGAWYYLPNEFTRGEEKEKFHGEANLADWVVENPESYVILEKMVLEKLQEGEINE